MLYKVGTLICLALSCLSAPELRCELPFERAENNTVTAP